MPSFCCDSNASKGAYVPPHMRVGYDPSFNNDVPKFVDISSSKLPNVESQKLLTNGENAYVDDVLLSKSYVPPAKRNFDIVGSPKYKDRTFKGNSFEYKKSLQESTTVYVGKLNLVSSKLDIHTFFSKAGDIKTITMGIEKETFAPAGFCFIEFKTRFGTENCMKMMQNSILDGKKLVIDWDMGFVEGRQYARRKVNLDQGQVSVFKSNYSFQGKKDHTISF